MIETNLQEAIAKISMDEDYRDKLINDPDKLFKDYGIKMQESLPIKEGDATMINKSFRPVGVCSCSTAPA